MKKLLRIAGISLGILLLLGFTLPFLFKDKLVRIARAEINKSLTAQVDFKNVDISFFRRFPRVSVRLEDLAVTGRDAFAGDTLMAAANVDASVNLFSFFSKTMQVDRVDIQSPRIHAWVNAAGGANWNITKPASGAASGDTAGGFHMNLQRYAIHNAHVLYEDETAGIRAELSGLDHEGSGDLTQDRFTLSTATRSAGASFSYARIPYLSDARIDLASDLVVDLKTNTYTLTGTKLSLNALTLTADGSLQLINDSSYGMDIRFKAPSAEFKEFLSLVPALYKTDFEKLRTAGTASFGGWVKGVYSAVQMPAYDLTATVANGSFQYPDLPQPVKNIAIDLHATNPDGRPDHAVIDLAKAHIEMGGSPFDLHLLYKNPETAPYIDGAAKGRLDLSQVASFIKLEKGTKLAGIVEADAFAKGLVKSMQGGGAFNAGGFFGIENLFYQSAAFPQAIRNGRMKIAVANTGGTADQTTINVTGGHVQLGTNPVDFSVTLQRPVTDLLFEGAAKGRLNLADLAQLGVLEPGSKLDGWLEADMRFGGSKAMVDRKAYDQVRLSGTASVANVTYDAANLQGPARIAAAHASFSPASASITGLDATYNKTRFTGSGTASNLLGYALQDGILSGRFDLAIDHMNLNEWMGTADASATTAAPGEAFLVPANLDLILQARAGNLHYDKVDYRNMSGTVILRNETATLQGLRTEALDGVITVNGTYSTRVHDAKPAISLVYAVTGVDIQKAFFAYNTMQKLMPIGKFLSGKLTSNMNLKGALQADGMPDLSSLTGAGNLLLLEGVLKGFAPLDKMATVLQISELKNIAVKELRSVFEFANGKVLVKPFNLNIKDIQMQIGGLHGFDQGIDYLVQMKVPRHYMGMAGNKLVTGLATTAAVNGIPLALGETINLNVRLGGTITNPTVRTDLTGAAGDAAKDLQAQAVAFAKQKVDSARQTFRDTVASVRKALTDEIRDGIRKQVLGGKDSSGARPLDSAKTKTVDRLKNAFGGLLNRKKAASDTSRH
ncbi:MAG: AsmA family protein [Flaviaesturariibacter sp.]|nr:AsmA family protein [Flaviaesturariibacter sp.]